MPKAPEIFKRSLDDIKLDGLPPRDAPGFEDAVLLTLTTQYATKGYTAAIDVQGGNVLGVAFPQEGVELRAKSCRTAMIEKNYQQLR